MLVRAYALDPSNVGILVMLAHYCLIKGEHDKVRGVVCARVLVCVCVFVLVFVLCLCKFAQTFAQPLTFISPSYYLNNSAGHHPRQGSHGSHRERCCAC